MFINATGFEENITELRPSTLYRVSVAAVNEDHAIGPALNLTVMTNNGTSNNGTPTGIM